MKFKFDLLVEDEEVCYKAQSFQPLPSSLVS